MQSIAVTAGLFELGADGTGQLLGGHCGACGRMHFPAGADCPYCSAEGCTTRALSDRGTLSLFTTVLNRPPGYTGDVPFGFGVVELPEGLRVITRLETTDVDALRFGMPVRAATAALHANADGDTVVTYTFVPA